VNADLDDLRSSTLPILTTASHSDSAIGAVRFRRSISVQLLNVMTNQPWE
jgi:hypothetical protein